MTGQYFLQSVNSYTPLNPIEHDPSCFDSLNFPSCASPLSCSCCFSPLSFIVVWSVLFFYAKLGTKNLDLGCPYNPVIKFGRVSCLSLNFPPNGIIKLILRVQYFPLDETTIRTKYLVSLDLMPCPTSVNLEAREICNVERTSEKHWQIYVEFFYNE